MATVHAKVLKIKIKTGLSGVDVRDSLRETITIYHLPIISSSKGSNYIKKALLGELIKSP